MGSTLKLRCVKVTHEDKRTSRYQEPETTEHIVECSFMSPELEAEAREGVVHAHAYLGVTLSAERYRELGYEVGKVYDLSPT